MIATLNFEFIIHKYIFAYEKHHQINYMIIVFLNIKHITPLPIAIHIINILYL